MTDPIATISTTLPTSASTSGSTSTDRSELSSQAFLQLLVAQLRYQDPSKPVDTATLMQQTATINQIQTMQKLSDATTAQLAAQQMQTAASLIGRTVSYQDANGATQSGYVSSASLSGAAPTVHIGTRDVDLSAITQITAGTTA